MTQSELQNNYLKLNNSFSKKLTFNLGTDAGFFSEFNNMILAILYCLDKQIKFTLYSKKANFALENGWNDFFEPFCPQTTFYPHYRYNRRSYQMKNTRKITPAILKVISGNEYLTQDIWDRFRNEKFAHKAFTFEELGLHNASILEASKTIIRMIWNYNSENFKDIIECKNSLNLPSSYVSFHIRSGDKSSETEVFNCEKYIKLAERKTEIRNAFILTDDYAQFEKLKNGFKNWCFFTLCKKEERGYYHSEFKNLNKAEKLDKLQRLFASVDICANASHFFGSYSSNPGMYMGMRMGEENCTAIDFDSWVLW